MTRVSTYTSQLNENPNLCDDMGWQDVKFPCYWKLLPYLYQARPDSGGFTQ